ncbi:hypothetical protein CKAH01_16970 [Colletotrichum kahawae]|uniref:Uncharacterized protein n=1 Tax=Colletotrichum kahawae TaxID=34407 RepID=A0AAD9YDY6_COLKA|nr:hypothetical protein CKAH01_16970 [Colletotrichum kahawae]
MHLRRETPRRGSQWPGDGQAPPSCSLHVPLHANVQAGPDKPCDASQHGLSSNGNLVFIYRFPSLPKQRFCMGHQPGLAMGCLSADLAAPYVPTGSIYLYWRKTYRCAVQNLNLSPPADPPASTGPQIQPDAYSLPSITGAHGPWTWVSDLSLGQPGAFEGFEGSPLSKKPPRFTASLGNSPDVTASSVGQCHSLSVCKEKALSKLASSLPVSVSTICHVTPKAGVHLRCPKPFGSLRG